MNSQFRSILESIDTLNPNDKSVGKDKVVSTLEDGHTIKDDKITISKPRRVNSEDPKENKPLDDYEDDEVVSESDNSNLTSPVYWFDAGSVDNSTEGTVSRNPEGTYNVHWDDGTVSNDVSRSNLIEVGNADEYLDEVTESTDSSILDDQVTNQATDTKDLSNRSYGALVASLVSNDIKHIHLHASGDKFDDIHNIAQEYYDKLALEVDLLCELALESKDYLPNLSVAMEYAPEYDISVAAEYEYTAAMSRLSEILLSYIEVLKELLNEYPAEDIQDELNTMIRYWSKEVEYKISKRLDSKEVIVEDGE